ncbi:MAG: cell division protein FtsA [Bacilli bacterium]|nr:cell division protein FtsA [Bacilli bacterium]
MSEIYTGIDLGTNSIKIVVAEKINDKFHVLAAVSSPSKGIKNGFIEDNKSAMASIKTALKKAEEALGFKIMKVIACIPTTNCCMDIVTGSVAIVDYNEITGTDVSNVLLESLKNQDFSERELVTAMPIHFTIDGNTNVKDPKGMKGSTLEVRAVVSTVPKEELYHLLEGLKQSGVETVDIAFNSVGDYYTIKNRKYDDLVGAIINIGESTTSVSVFNKGIMIKNSILPVGSNNVDKDITYAFKSKSEDSRKIKETFALALSSYADEEEIYTLHFDKDTTKEVNQVMASKVVEARVREILKLAKNDIKNLTNREIRYIIVTGGLTELSGFSYLVEQEYGFVAKVCDNQMMGVRHNEFSSCYGIVKYFDDKLQLRGKQYEMISKENQQALRTMDSSLSKENLLHKVFGHFFEH